MPGFISWFSPHYYFAADTDCRRTAAFAAIMFRFRHFSGESVETLPPDFARLIFSLTPPQLLFSPPSFLELFASVASSLPPFIE